ncbi:selenocysteine-specific translation elongation factor [Kamptonema cortianum]|nr:selenocysteine-specific translation elongation factor [Kamptonema cortianum]
MRVLATAGHVDHGKSSLVKALTGTDPDRLAEEKARQMTIDLGFAALSVGGETVGLVDVPGHRDFIGNMLSGVGGIDAALVVIAADEGIMPQTREHLSILSLLEVSHGIVILSKIDLIEDSEWLALVEAEIRDTLRHSTLAQAPIVRVSAALGTGLETLRTAIAALLSELPSRPSNLIPRLPIDRVFTLRGFGTVVTGTLLGGDLPSGIEVQLEPRGLRARVRSLQSFHQVVPLAAAGSRAAVNLAGVSTNDVRRGDVLTLAGHSAATSLCDIQLTLLKEASRPIRHNTAVRVYTGTAALNARVRLLEADTLSPGQTGWAQLLLSEPAAIFDGDRFIVRFPSPPETIGGGKVLSAHPPRTWRRRDPKVLAMFQNGSALTPEMRIARAAQGEIPVRAEIVLSRSGLQAEQFDAALALAVNSRLVIAFPEGLLNADSAAALLHRARILLRQFHTAFPLRLGMPREEFGSRLNLRQPTITHLGALDEEVVIERGIVRMRDHAIQFSTEQERAAQRLLDQMRVQPMSPPSYGEAAALASEAVIRALLDLETLILLQPGLIFLRSSYEQAVAMVRRHIAVNGQITAAECRDQLGTSRKIAIALLEYMDAQGITRRTGEVRVLGPAAR